MSRVCQPSHPKQLAWYASMIFCGVGHTAHVVRLPLLPVTWFVIQAGQIAAAEGASGLVLHARTADQQYSPPCHWDAVAQLVAAVPPNVPVIGNGDVFEAADAVQMLRQTGCRGKAHGFCTSCLPGQQLQQRYGLSSCVAVLQSCGNATRCNAYRP